jgi:hypothetical protein
MDLWVETRCSLMFYYLTIGTFNLINTNYYCVFTLNLTTSTNQQLAEQLAEWYSNLLERQLRNWLIKRFNADVTEVLHWFLFWMTLIQHSFSRSIITESYKSYDTHKWLSYMMYRPFRKPKKDPVQCTVAYLLRAKTVKPSETALAREQLCKYARW